MGSVSSSAIRHLVYNPARQELHVFFRGSGDYTYFDVPEAEYQALSVARSKGAFLNKRIKGRYRCARRGPPKRRIWLDERRWPFQETSA